jgi:hypothetical protein
MNVLAGLNFTSPDENDSGNDIDPAITCVLAGASAIQENGTMVFIVRSGTQCALSAGFRRNGNEWLLNK